MKQIDLLNTNNRINVDDADYERLSRFKWTQTPEGYAATHIDGHPLYLHDMVNSFIAESDPEEEHDRESTFMAELLNMLDRVGIKPLMEKSCQRENSTDSSYNVMLEFNKDSIDKIKAYASAFGYRVTSVNQSKLDADYRRVNLCSKPGINSVILKKIQKGERWKLNRSDIIAFSQLLDTARPPTPSWPLSPCLESIDCSSIELFDFRENWDRVQPFVHQPELEALLEAGVNGFLEWRRDDCARRGLDPTHWGKRKYDPESGPWSYTSCDAWCTRADELAAAAIERGEFSWGIAEDEDPTQEQLDKYDEFASQFYPQPDTCEWFQLWQAAYWLAPWLQELGKLVFPDLQWDVLRRGGLSFAYGSDGDGSVRVIFDLLHFDCWSTEGLIAEALNYNRELENGDLCHWM